MSLPPERSQPNTGTPTSRHPSSKKTEIKFEPLSAGLGFHPFSDGLPYAPMAKTPGPGAPGKSAPSKTAAPNNGAGAVAAGLPGYMPPPAAPRISAPTVSPRSPQALAAQAAAISRVAGPRPATSARTPQQHVPAQPFSHPKPVAKVPSAQSIPTVEALAASLTPELLQPRYGFGYLFKRMLAYLVDSAFNLALCGGALSVALWKQDLSPNLLLNPGIVLIAALFVGFFNWAITTAQEVAFGTSVGKRLFGLAIHGTASAIFLRAFFFLPSVCFGGMGLLWALFDRRRRCWHDLVVDLQPIEIARL